MRNNYTFRELAFLSMRLVNQALMRAYRAFDRVRNKVNFNHLIDMWDRPQDANSARYCIGTIPVPGLDYEISVAMFISGFVTIAFDYEYDERHIDETSIPSFRALFNPAASTYVTRNGQLVVELIDIHFDILPDDDDSYPGMGMDPRKAASTYGHAIEIDYVFRPPIRSETANKVLAALNEECMCQECLKNENPYHFLDQIVIDMTVPRELVIKAMSDVMISVDKALQEIFDMPI